MCVCVCVLFELLGSSALLTVSFPLREMRVGKLHGTHSRKHTVEPTGQSMFCFCLPHEGGQNLRMDVGITLHIKVIDMSSIGGLHIGRMKWSIGLKPVYSVVKPWNELLWSWVLISILQRGIRRRVEESGEDGGDRSKGLGMT